MTAPISRAYAQVLKENLALTKQVRRAERLAQEHLQWLRFQHADYANTPTMLALLIALRTTK